MFSAFITRRLIRKASNPEAPERRKAVRALGEQTMNEEIIACLSAIVRECRHQPTGMAVEAAKALAQSGDLRVSTALAELLDHESTYDLRDYLVVTLSHPRHRSAVAPIVAAALRELRATGHCHWLEKLLAAIGTEEARKAWQDFRIASVDPVLAAARAEMKLAMIPEWAESRLAEIGTPHACQALDTLRREMVWPLLHICQTSEDYDGVGQAVAKLKALKSLSVPGATEAVQEFLARPARKLIQWIYREEHVESGALESWTEKVERSSSNFGQRPKM